MFFLPLEKEGKDPKKVKCETGKKSKKLFSLPPLSISLYMTILYDSKQSLILTPTGERLFHTFSIGSSPSQVCSDTANSLNHADHDLTHLSNSIKCQQVSVKSPRYEKSPSYGIYHHQLYLIHLFLCPPRTVSLVVFYTYRDFKYESLSSFNTSSTPIHK